MLFTRFRQYLLNKKYSSFFLEFCILVLGVYLSLQVNEWEIESVYFPDQRDQKPVT